MLLNMHQHTNFVGMCESAKSTLVVLETTWLVIHSGMTSGGIANSGMTTIGKGFTKELGDGGAAGSGYDVGTTQ